MSTPGLLKMHNAIREAIEIDDMLYLSRLPKTYGVRDYSDWREWADSLEIELDKRKIKFAKVEC
ncbi:MAG TPA: hypothetical protein VNQ76_01160 [Planctomicrobium sp.]|nr:hypothetical protein [Planctomicrobium sp.]